MSETCVRPIVSASGRISAAQLGKSACIDRPAPTKIAATRSAEPFDSPMRIYRHGPIFPRDAYNAARYMLSAPELTRQLLPGG